MPMVIAADDGWTSAFTLLFPGQLEMVLKSMAPSRGLQSNLLNVTYRTFILNVFY